MFVSRVGRVYTRLDNPLELAQKASPDMSSSASAPTAPPRVGLFVTCLVDLMRPSVGFAAVKLLEEAGCTVEVPPTQTCCGQPAFNSGNQPDARALARQTIQAFEGYDYVVAPSGSCAGMLKTHYPELLSGDPAWGRRAKEFSERTHELISFLVDVRKVTRVAARFDGSVTYHDSCSGLRELGIQAQPRALLGTVEGLTLTELDEAHVCCGFGGTFATKYPEISNAMVERKAQKISETKAHCVLAGDLGCLLNMRGKLSRLGTQVSARHVAEVLAGMTDTPAIGEAEKRR
jgi:L-lactate dehydrogenase complex protein LldE